MKTTTQTLPATRTPAPETTPSRSRVTPPRYDETFRRQAVEHWLRSGLPGTRIARELGISYPTLKEWKRRYTGDALPQRAGPTAVVLTQPKLWTIGALVGNMWSYAGASDRASVNQMFFQYFINYGLDGGWYLTTTPTMTANWHAPSNERWTIPVGGGAGKLFNIGKLPVRTQLQAFYNVERPTGGADWSLMLTVQLVFPK